LYQVLLSTLLSAMSLMLLSGWLLAYVHYTLSLLQKMRYKKIGKTKLGENIYLDTRDKLIVIERDYERIVTATEEDLEGAKLEIKLQELKNEKPSN